MPAQQLDVGLNLENTHVLITGGAGLIGRAVVSAFLSAGACVTSLDIAYPALSGELSDHSDEFAKFHSELRSSPDGKDQLQNPAHSKLLPMQANTADEEQLETAWGAAVERFGPVQCCIALAAKDLSVLQHSGLVDVEPQQWLDTLHANVGGPMLVARQWLRGLRAAEKGQLSGRRNINLIMVGSESGWFGERTNPDYAASKAAVQVGLLQSLKAEAPRIFDGARVNAIAPGPVDTTRFKQECSENPAQYYLDAEGTVALGRPVPVESVAKSILFLSSDNLSGNVHGQVLNVDSGKQGKVMWMRGERS